MDRAKGGRAAERALFIDRAADQPIYLQLAQSLRQVINEDMRKIPSLLAQVQTLTEGKPEPEQLSMF